MSDHFFPYKHHPMIMDSYNSSKQKIDLYSFRGDT